MNCKSSGSSLFSGQHVAAHGLSNQIDLNVTNGVLRKFDDGSGRWEVELDDVGFRKLKPANLVPSPPELHELHPRRRVRLCKFGQSCYRPECWFAHPDESARVSKMSRVWEDLDQACKYTTSSAPPSRTCSKTDLVGNGLDVESSIDLLEKRCNQFLADMDEKAKRSEVTFSKYVDDRLAMMDSTCPRSMLQSHLQTDVGMLADLSATKCAQLEKRIEEHVHDHRNTVADLHVLLHACAKTTNIESMIEDKLEAGMRELLFGSLQAALVPLVNEFEKRMARFEAKFDHDFAATDVT